MNAIEELRYLILAAQREGTRAVAALLRPLGLTPSQAEALDVLHGSGRPLTVKEVGERLICEHGSPSRLMQTLVGKGLVEAARDARDARATRLCLTDAGRAVVGRVREARGPLDSLIAAELDPATARHLTRALRSIVRDRPAGRALARRLEDEAGTRPAAELSVAGGANARS